jgi:hypothetical protein
MLHEEEQNYQLITKALRKIAHELHGASSAQAALAIIARATRAQGIGRMMGVDGCCHGIGGTAKADKYEEA